MNIEALRAGISAQFLVLVDRVDGRKLHTFEI